MIRKLEAKKYIEWSPHRLMTWEACPRRYFYQYVQKPRPDVPIFPEFAKGIALHRRITYFYKPDGTPKYKSAETFANSVVGPWREMVRPRIINGRVRQGSVNGREIAWRDEKQPYWIEDDMKKILRTIYEPYAASKPPVFKEYNVKPIFVSLNGENYFCLNGRIDEVRLNKNGFNGLVIRDHKSSKDTPTLAGLAADIQFTFYPLLLAEEIRNGMFEKKLTENTHAPKNLNEGAYFVSQEMRERSLVELATRIDLEYHEMRTGRVFAVPRRAPEDFSKPLERIARAEGEIKQAYDSGIWEGDSRSCSNCLFYKICDADSKAMISGAPTPERPQGTLFSVSWTYHIKKREKHPRLPFPRAQRKKAST